MEDRSESEDFNVLTVNLCQSQLLYLNAEMLLLCNKNLKYRKIWNHFILRQKKRKWNHFVVCIFKTDSCANLNKQIIKQIGL